MSNYTPQLYYASKYLKEFLEDSAIPWVNKELETEKIADTVRLHALGAAASGLGVAVLPGAGSTAAMVAAVGFIWSMYFRINKLIGLKMSKVLLKTLASAILSNLVQSAITVLGAVAVSFGLSFIPIIGSFGASLIMAALDYAIVVVGGIIYLKLLRKILSAGKDPSEMTEEQLKKSAESVIKQENVGEMIKKTAKEYREGRKSGTITGKEKIDLEE